MAICFGAAGAEMPELRIRVTEMKPKANGVLEVQFWNDSNHELRVPAMMGFCRPDPGNIHAEVLEAPPTPEGADYGMGCYSCGWLRPILEQAKGWTVPKPGQSFTAEAHLDMMLPFHGDGVYRFRLAHSRPQFNPNEWRDLKEAGIEVPMTDAESKPISIELLSGHLTLLLGTS